MKKLVFLLIALLLVFPVVAEESFGELWMRLSPREQRTACLGWIAAMSIVHQLEGELSSLSIERFAKNATYENIDAMARAITDYLNAHKDRWTDSPDITMAWAFNDYLSRRSSGL